MHLNYKSICITILLIHQALGVPLDIVAGKSGEEQVKEALDRAEKESEEAAKVKDKPSTFVKDKDEANSILNSIRKEVENDTGGDINTRSSTDLKSTLDKKVAELAKFHEKHKTSEPHSVTDTLIKDIKLKELSELKKVEKVPAITDKKLTEIKEKENGALEDESDTKMVEMAKKLNNLVVKFQNKMGRLSHRPKNTEGLLPEKDGDGESTVKSIRGKPATHAPVDLAALMMKLHPKAAPATHSAIDMAGLRNALGLLHSKSSPKDESSGKTSYKEDTKLEDRLAMEAEEEKKFSNGDNYDDGEDGGATKGSSSSSATATSTLSPKEQASQEMQNYNALISSESNRELTQIQDEITKATQSSMGQVSVVGQKEQVNTEAPNVPTLPPLPGLSDPGMNPSSLDAAAAFGGAGGLGGLTGGGSLTGGSSTDPFASLQGAGEAGGAGAAAAGGPDGLMAAATASEVSSQPSSTMTGFSDPNAAGAQQAAQSSPFGGGGEQAPIEIGNSQQQPVEMGTLGAGANPFQNSQLNPMEGMPATDQSQQNFMQPQTQQSPIEFGGQFGGGAPQQSMAFKKSKISSKKTKIKSYHSARVRKESIAKHTFHLTKVGNSQKKFSKV